MSEIDRIRVDVGPPITSVQVQIPGAQGPTGETGTISVGTVTTLAPGSQATVTNVGTSTAAEFDFGIPQGAAGEDVQTVIDASASKVTPVDADEVVITDSAASGVLKVVTWANIKATLLAVFGSNGIVARTAAGTFAARTITGTSNQISVSNGDGVSGNPTLSLPADVAIPTVVTVPNTGLHILDSDASHDLIIAPGSNLSADRTLTITTGDANRTLTLNADTNISSFAASFLDDADAATARATLGAQTLDATLTSLASYNTNGLLTQTAADTFAGRTITGTANQITVTNGDGVSGNPTLSLPADVVIPTVITAPNTGLHILDTNASHDLIIAPGSNLTADRTLTLTTGDANRTLTLNADTNISSFAATFLDDPDAATVRTTLGISTLDNFSGSLLHVCDEKASGTDGGGSTATTWNIRTLNTVRTNQISGASLASSEVTLPAGTYWLEAEAPCYQGVLNKLRLYNVTDAAVVTDMYGVNGRFNNAQSAGIVPLSGKFTLASSKNLRLEHYTSATSASTGLGAAVSAASTPEIYAVVKIWKVA